MYCVYLKKKIIYTSNGGGQMIVWPPDFPVWGGPWPLGPPPWVRHWVAEWIKPSEPALGDHVFEYLEFEYHGSC